MLRFMLSGMVVLAVVLSTPVAGQIFAPYECVEPSPGAGACAGYDYGDFGQGDEWVIIAGACIPSQGCLIFLLHCGDYSVSCGLLDAFA